MLTQRTIFSLFQYIILENVISSSVSPLVHNVLVDLGNKSDNQITPVYHNILVVLITHSGDRITPLLQIVLVDLENNMTDQMKNASEMIDPCQLHLHNLINPLHLEMGFVYKKDKRDCATIKIFPVDDRYKMVLTEGGDNN